MWTLNWDICFDQNIATCITNRTCHTFTWSDSTDPKPNIIKSCIMLNTSQRDNRQARKLFGKENYKAGKGCQSWGRCMNIHDCSSAQQHIHFPVPPSQHHLCLLVFTSASPEKRIQWFWCIQLTVGSSFFMFTQWVWAGARELYQSAKPLAVAGTPKVSVLLSSKTVGGRPKRVLNCATTTPIKGSNSWPTTSQALQFVQDAILQN
jgi:hypothetical protein